MHSCPPGTTLQQTDVAHPIYFNEVYRLQDYRIAQEVYIVTFAGKHKTSFDTVNSGQNLVEVLTD